MNDMSQFIDDLKEFDIVLSEKQKEQFLKYYELLIEWNSYMNLTSITGYEDVLKKHFLDSISLVKVYGKMRMEEVSMIDVGTGAGFPGIPLKIVFPDTKLTLLDSLQKRMRFLNEVVKTIELDNVHIIHGRAEDYAKPTQLRECFDICVSRAVANLSTLSELCLPFVKTGGIFVSYKSEKIAEESVAAKYAISVLGGRVEKQESFMLPHSDIYRSLFVVYKERKTPTRYPRKAGLPSKEPLNK